ncbi:hypothetical protein C8Q77DRAFT_1059165 [Trametes polyzona]|nr:hypothetical protein C8Q77DRAFT_1059165 [Trametes polyzona]
MSAAGATVKQQMQRIAAKWPGDPFRPNIQLKTLLESLAEHPNLTPTAVRAARALQEDQFKTKYALSEKTLRPASFPHYYTRLVEAFDKSAKGIGRPWWKIFFNIW